MGGLIPKPHIIICVRVFRPNEAVQIKTLMQEFILITPSFAIGSTRCGSCSTRTLK